MSNNRPVEKWVLVDLDGTLCNTAHRLYFLKPRHDIQGTAEIGTCAYCGQNLNRQEWAGEPCDSREPDWQGFNSMCHADPCYQDVVDLVHSLFYSGWKVAIMTGRDAQWRRMTQNWLDEMEVPRNLLIMRPTGNHRPDVELKADLFDIWMKDRNVRLVLEDRDKVVELWRGMGLTCLQPRKGDY